MDRTSPEEEFKFYREQNGFRLFGERITERGEEGHRLMQLLNFL